MSDVTAGAPAETAVPGRSPRLEYFLPEQLSSDQRAMYDEITRGPRSAGPQVFPLTGQDGCLLGPFNAMLLSHQVGGPLQRLGAAIRHRSTLSGRHREIAILIVAYHWNSLFEAYAHEAVARAVGVTDEEIDALRELRLDEFAGADAIVVQTASALVTTGDLGDEDYAAAVSAVGSHGLFEITTLIGYYATLALQMRVFGVDDAPAGERAKLGRSRGQCLPISGVGEAGPAVDVGSQFVVEDAGADL